MLTLALIFFVTGLVAFLTALSSPKPNSPQMTPLAVVTPVPQTSIAPIINGKLIITPNGKNSEIRVGRNSFEVRSAQLNFNLNTIPPQSSIKSAILKLNQKNIIGKPFLGNTVEVDDIGTISKDEELEIKELDVTQKIKDLISQNENQVSFTIHFSNDKKGVTPEGDFVIFESIPQLVVTFN